MNDTLSLPLERRYRAVGVWLFAVAAMVFVMVVIGGLTRLTESGLSMVEWRPVTGWLPPLSEAAWQDTFQAYRATPEYQKVNAGMSLDEFKGIFWLEYVHRLWGRLIGLAFAVPLVVFLARGWLDRRLAPRLVLLFVLGGLQGALGWFMVASGLVDRPDVSQYRLVAHFGAALLIYVALLWVALGLVVRTPPWNPSRGLGRGILALGALAVVTMLSGGFVAGTDAGYAYNSFPLMDGQLVPDGLMSMSPAYLNFFENITTVQFTHRALAMTTLAAVILFWLLARRRPMPRRARLAVHAVLAAALAQVALGISTLVLVMPIALAALHQTVGVILLTTIVWAAFELRPLAERAAAPVAYRGAARSGVGAG
ncbi:MAG: COX15/CtaA family protein [Rhodospirillales bacterium]|nr:COX15/CtaA family protein [Rhodospirillales bacterium]